jgi:membrane-bound serine protease (ClpP class)
LLLIGGLTCFIIGSYMLVDTSVPGYGGVSRPIIWTASALILGCAILIGTAVIRVMGNKHATGKSTLIGETGEVREALKPSGMIFLQGELWIATVEGLAPGVTEVPIGDHVAVTAIHGLRLVVKPTESPVTIIPPPPGVPRGASVIPVVGGVQELQLDKAHWQERPKTGDT